MQCHVLWICMQMHNYKNRLCCTRVLTLYNTSCDACDQYNNIIITLHIMVMVAAKYMHITIIIWIDAKDRKSIDFDIGTVHYIAMYHTISK